MISIVPTQVQAVYKKDFSNPQTSLLAYRINPFRFELNGNGQSVASPHLVYEQTDYSEAGAKALVNHIKVQAELQAEVWSSEQLQSISGSKCIYIVYNSFNRMYLRPSRKGLTIEELQTENPDSQVFLRQLPKQGASFGAWLQECAPVLIDLVEELLSWMPTSPD